ncbi:hypothetical protein FGO68_gene17093 [Halteria grandinella]|uniref:Serine hydrolase domain-containing protein n=1 Tax=Halteria grandinella TaxID=5974 RepID=A0A8J8SVG2_HALGN|nr:hypothetical protein FGO68_gene17093 [Halteria grandinella]
MTEPLHIPQYHFKHHPQGGDKFGYQWGVEYSNNLIVKAIQEQGPFDGFLCFSQGAQMLRFAHFYTQELFKEKYSSIPWPKFAMTYGGQILTSVRMIIDGKVYDQQKDIKIHMPNGSIHVVGTKDPTYALCKIEPLQYTNNPVAIVHGEGHKVMHEYKDPEHIRIMEEFIEKQMRSKKESIDTLIKSKL